MDRAVLLEICESLPVFPLPRTVLMPGQHLPLHVFEPRYRALVQHCLDGAGVMGVATLRPGFEETYYEAPAIHSEIGLGRLIQHQGFPDGRSNIVVEYVGRARLEHEVPGEGLFRVVKGALVDDDPTGVDQPLQRLRVLVLQLGSVSAEAAAEARRLVELDNFEMVDSLARKLLEEPDERRAYLGEPRITGRIAVVVDRLSRFLAIAVPAAEA